MRPIQFRVTSDAPRLGLPFLLLAADWLRGAGAASQTFSRQSQTEWGAATPRRSGPHQTPTSPLGSGRQEHSMKSARILCVFFSLATLLGTRSGQAQWTVFDPTN